MTQSREQAQEAFRAVLTPHRSLSPIGFLVLMGVFGAFNLLLGLAFWLLGAWPVIGFCGLDIAIVYVAFRLSYRSGRLYETVEVTPDVLTWTRVHPDGRQERFACNPYWARVRIDEGMDGRTDLRLRAEGRELSFARFLTDDERRDLARALRSALADARTSWR